MSCNVMIEATASFRLDPTSILDVYKVFGTLIWCEWEYRAVLTLLGLYVGDGFWGFGGRSEPK